jgi:ribosome-associated translation inhibitor RaiA
MKRTQEARKLRTNLDTKNCTLRRSEIEAMEDSLGSLEAVAGSFPFADLYVTISYSPRSEEYHVKTSLKLPGRVLFTGEHDSVALPAYERCIRKLVRKVEDYKHLMETGHGAKSKLAQGTLQEMDPTELPDLEGLQRAYGAQDYNAFRRQLYGFEEPVRRRIGRWIQRYPELDETFGEYLPLDDLVEEVMLTAFEQYESKPDALRLGDWLESLIDPALRNFLRHPEEELEAISYARTLREMHGETEPVVSGKAALDTPVRETDACSDPGTGTEPELGGGGACVIRKPR